MATSANKRSDRAQEAASLPALYIAGSSDTVPPGNDCQLLLSFAFGVAESERTHPAVVHPGLHPVGATPRYENWWFRGDVQFRRHGPVHLAECSDYAVASLELEEKDSDDYRQFTQNAYRQLMAALATTAHPRIAKIWNYLGGINLGQEDDERYRQFSAGRADIFDELTLRDSDAPTGTAVGTQSNRGLVITALATSDDCGLVENPRQISAFNYPRQYGPRTPRFSRAGYVVADTHTLMLISGTAAIVGHESAHPYDVIRQTSETLRNLDTLCNSVAKMLNIDEGNTLALDNGAALRVYLRNPDDLPGVRERLAAKGIHHGDSVIFLHGNICRKELMVEIDAVKVI